MITKPSAWCLSPAESLCALLLGGGSFDSIRPLNDEQSKLLLALLLRNWQVLPVMRCPGTDQALRMALRESDYRSFASASLAIEAFARTQYVVTKPLLDALQRAGIDYCVLKGAASANLLYEQPQHRAGWDVDIGVRRQDLKDAEALAVEAGFLRAQQDPCTKRFHAADIRLRASVESQHHELGFLIRRQFVTNLDADSLQAIRTSPWSHRYWHDADGASVPWCYSAVDIHHGIASGIGLAEVIDDAQWIESRMGRIMVPSHDWMAAILVYKIYWEGVHQYREGLYQYADLSRLLPQLSDSEFLRFIEHLEEMNLIAAAHYVVRRIPVFGVPLKQRDEVLLKLSDLVPDAKPVQMNDLGDMWPKLWGRRVLC